MTSTSVFPYINVKPARPLLGTTEIEEHLNNPYNVMSVSVADITQSVGIHCMDGRSRTEVLGTAGGNIGLFVETLTSMEMILGKVLPATLINQLFQKYVGTFGRFYLHTDSHALEHLKEKLSGDPLFSEIDHLLVDDIELFLLQPPMQVQIALLDYLTDPEFVGCGHLRLMLSKPLMYGVRPELVRDAMKAFYRGLWGQWGDEIKNQLDHEMLRDNHAEGAIVYVQIEGEVNQSSQIPVLQPAADGRQFFVIHPQVENLVRTLIAEAVVAGKWMPELNEQVSQNFVACMKKFGAEVQRESASHLALGLPAYQATFSGNHQ